MYRHSLRDTRAPALQAPLAARGFSFLELMAVLAISALFASLAAPNLGIWISESRLIATGQALAADIGFARAKARRLQRYVALCHGQLGDCGQGSGTADSQLGTTSTHWFDSPQPREQALTHWVLASYTPAAATDWALERSHQGRDQPLQLRSIRETSRRRIHLGSAPPEQLGGIAFLVSPQGRLLRRDTQGFYSSDIVWRLCDPRMDIFVDFSINSIGSARQVNRGANCNA